MKNYIKDQHELYLVDLIKYLLKKCFIIFTVAVLCAAAVGGYKYKSGGNITVDNTETESDNSVDYDRLITSYNSSQTGLDMAMLGIYDAICNQNAYFENSILYRLDCNSAPTTMLGYDIVITPDNYENETEGVYNYYLYNVVNGDYIVDLASEIGTEPQYLMELIVVEETVGEIIQPVNNSSYSVATTLAITVNGLDEEMCNVIADRVEEEMNLLYQNDPANTRYTLTETYRTYSNVHSNRIMEAQQISIGYYDTLFGKLKNYSGYKNNISAPVARGGNSAAPKNTLKYVALGGIFGAILACVCLILFYLFDDRVSDEKRFSCRYNVSYLGSNPAMIATNIKLALGEGSTIVFAGMTDKSDVDTLVDSIKADLKNYTLVLATDILHDAEQRMKLNQSDNIVLIEKKKKSKYSDVDEELKVMSCMNKNVVGVVLV